jgi:glycosyltransferase involved in cell wall biosynthesis
MPAGDKGADYMRVSEYFRHLIETDPTEYEFGLRFRNLWKGVLDFIRNLVVIAFLNFVSVKTGSIAVKALYEISLATLCLYLLAFMSLSFNVFAFVKNATVRSRLNHVSYIAVAMTLYWTIRPIINYAVEEIAKGQLIK